MWLKSVIVKMALQYAVRPIIKIIIIIEKK